MDQELLAMKAETQQRIRMNLLSSFCSSSARIINWGVRETQLMILAELEQKLEAPLPDTRVKFLNDTVHLEREIAGVGK